MRTDLRAQKRKLRFEALLLFLLPHFFLIQQKGDEAVSCADRRYKDYRYYGPENIEMVPNQVMRNDPFFQKHLKNSINKYQGQQREQVGRHSLPLEYFWNEPFGIDEEERDVRQGNRYNSQ